MTAGTIPATGFTSIRPTATLFRTTTAPATIFQAFIFTAPTITRYPEILPAEGDALPISSHPIMI
jgi:hypothetical protein